MLTKRNRTSELLEKRLRKNPNDYEAHYYFAQLYVGGGVKYANKVINHATRCLELIPVDDPKNLSYFGVLYFWMAHAFLLLMDGANRGC